MDNRELTSAANALIQWFNSQEIPPADAEVIMLKVAAKLIIARIDTKAPDLTRFNGELDHHMESLSHELLTRIYQVKKGRA